MWRLGFLFIAVLSPPSSSLFLPTTRVSLRASPTSPIATKLAWPTGRCHLAADSFWLGISNIIVILSL